MCSWRGAVIDQGQASDIDIKEVEIQDDPLGVLTCNYMVFFQFRKERKLPNLSVFCKYICRVAVHLANPAVSCVFVGF